MADSGFGCDHSSELASSDVESVDCKDQVKEQNLSAELPPSILTFRNEYLNEATPDTGNSGLSSESSNISSMDGSFPTFLHGPPQDFNAPFTITDD